MIDDYDFDADAIDGDLGADDPARVARGLRALEVAMRIVPYQSLPFPDPSCLVSFADGAPAEIVDCYLTVAPRYHDGDESGDSLWDSLVEVVVEHGNESHAQRLARMIVEDEIAPYVVADVMMNLRLRELTSPRHVSIATELVKSLLLFKGTRSATVDGLAYWAKIFGPIEIVDAVRPLLEQSELARLAPDED